MPMPSTLFWLVVNLFLAFGINWLARELGLINNSEIIALYFLIVAARYHDAQSKFSLAYAQNPDLIEYILRQQLEKEKGE